MTIIGTKCQDKSAKSSFVIYECKVLIQVPFFIYSLSLCLSSEKWLACVFVFLRFWSPNPTSLPQPPHSCPPPASRPPSLFSPRRESKVQSEAQVPKVILAGRCSKSSAVTGTVVVRAIVRAEGQVGLGYVEQLTWLRKYFGWTLLRGDVILSSAKKKKSMIQASNIPIKLKRCIHWTASALDAAILSILSVICEADYVLTFHV